MHCKSSRARAFSSGQTSRAAEIEHLVQGLRSKRRELASIEREIAENLAAQETRRERLTTALTTQVQAIDAVRTGVIDINSALVTAGEAARRVPAQHRRWARGWDHSCPLPRRGFVPHHT